MSLAVGAIVAVKNIPVGSFVMTDKGIGVLYSHKFGQYSVLDAHSLEFRDVDRESMGQVLMLRTELAQVGLQYIQHLLNNQE